MGKWQTNNLRFLVLRASFSSIFLLTAFPAASGALLFMVPFRWITELICGGQCAVSIEQLLMSRPRLDGELLFKTMKNNTYFELLEHNKRDSCVEEKRRRTRAVGWIVENMISLLISV